MCRYIFLIQFLLLTQIQNIKSLCTDDIATKQGRFSYENVSPDVLATVIYFTVKAFTEKKTTSNLFKLKYLAASTPRLEKNTFSFTGGHIPCYTRDTRGAQVGLGEYFDRDDTAARSEGKRALREGQVR